MAFKGQVWDDPASNSKVEVLETAADTNGDRLCYRFTLKAGGFRPVLHLHEKQDEVFEILSGKLTYHLNGKVKIAGKGERIVLPKGSPHTHYNNEASDLVMLQSITPALDAEWLIDSILGLTMDGRIVNGKPKFLQVMIWLRYYNARTYLATIPIPVQNCLAFILAPIARLMGYKAAYKKYSGVDA